MQNHNANHRVNPTVNPHVFINTPQPNEDNLPRFLTLRRETTSYPPMSQPINSFASQPIHVFSHYYYNPK